MNNAQRFPFVNSVLSKLYHKKIKISPLKYVGGKFRNRELIVQHLLEIYDPYSRIQFREPFSGPASITFEMMAKTNIHRYWINDIDPAIFCYLLSLKENGLLFQKYIRERIPTKSEYNQYRNNLIELKGIPSERKLIDAAYQKMVVQRLSFSGYGTKSTTPISDIERRWSTDSLCAALEIMHSRISDNDVKITNLDFGKLISNDSYPALLYVDPPYYQQGNRLYQYGMSDSDHIRLSELLRRTKHKFLLSYDNCPEIWDLYGTWAKVTVFECWHSNSNSKGIKTELLITNS